MPKIFGGGGTTDAGDLTTGTLDAARLPGVLANVDTQAELLSAAAAAAASHTHAASDIASGSLAAARLADGTATAGYVPMSDGDGTSTWGAVSDSTKLPLSGGAMTGALQWSGTQTSAGNSIVNLFRDSTGDLNINVDTGDVVDFLVSGTSQATIGSGGLIFPANNSPGASAYAVFRESGGATILQGAAGGGYSVMSSNGGATPRHLVCGASTGFCDGGIISSPAGVSLAAAGTRTVVTGAKSGTVTLINATDYKRATFSVEAGTPVKIEGDASFVAGSPGASQIGLELSSATLRVNNGYAGAKLIAIHAILNNV